MGSRLALNETKTSKLSRRDSPLSTRDYIAMELPIHLYLVALVTGRLSHENWVALMLHVSMVMQLAATHDHQEVIWMTKKAMTILNAAFLNHTKLGFWAISEKEYDTLGTLMSSLGAYYGDFPRTAVKKAALEGGLAMRSTLTNFGMSL